MNFAIMGIAGAFFIGCCPYLVLTLLAKDRILKTIYDEYPELWLKLGKPIGWLWRGSTSSLFGRHPELHECDHIESIGWLESAEPSWLIRYPKIEVDYRCVRKRMRIWNFVLMPIFFVSVALATVGGILLSP